MVKYLCKSDYTSKSGAKFCEGIIYDVGEVYFHYREVIHIRGLRCYIDRSIFNDYFIHCDDVVVMEVDLLFNNIMDGE